MPMLGWHSWLTEKCQCRTNFSQAFRHSAWRLIYQPRSPVFSHRSSFTELKVYPWGAEPRYNRTRACRTANQHITTQLSGTLMSNTAPFWATLHPTELRCILLSYAASYWATLHPTELRCTHLSYTEPSWAVIHPNELRCKLVSYAALLSYAALFWAMLHPTELRCIKLSYTAPSRAMMHPTVQWCNINYAAP